MTKAEFIDSVASKAGLSKKDAGAAVDAVLDTVDEALETARAERVNPTADYLLGIPMLSDYLEEGLEKLGYSIEDAEEDLL